MVGSLKGDEGDTTRGKENRLWAANSRNVHPMQAFDSSCICVCVCVCVCVCARAQHAGVIV